MLDLEPTADIYAQPWVGASWEGWVIEQILSHLQSTGQLYQSFYLRTSDQQEVDLLLQWRKALWAIEIKLTSVPDSADLERMKRTAALVGADYSVLLSRVSEPVRGKKEFSLNLAATLEMLEG